MEMEEESCFPNLGSQSEAEICSENMLKKVKSETVTSGSDCDLDSKTGTEEEAVVSNFCSQDQKEITSENPVMDSELLEPKIEIKEEHCWEETNSAETLCVYDDIEDRTDKNSDSIKSPSLYKVDVSSYAPYLFSKEDLGNDVSFNMRKDSLESESAKKCQSQGSDITGKSSMETYVYSETPDDREIVSMASCFEENANILDTSKENCKLVLSRECKKMYKSDICEKSVKSPSQITKKLFPKGKEAKICDVCGKSFNHTSSLKRHKLIHEGTKPHKCDVCNKAFNDLGYLKTHKLIHEGIKPYKCNVCDKAFTDLSNLKTHKLIHEGLKPNKCNMCDKAFAQLQHLKRHKLIHQGIKPHMCNICDKAFTRVQHLKRHKLVHDDIKPHQCDICDKSFTQLQNLKTHSLTHEGIKPHKCNICDKTFTRSQCLKTHSLIHEGIKPNKCDICDKAFTQLSTLKRHKMIHEDRNLQ